MEDIFAIATPEEIDVVFGGVISDEHPEDDFYEWESYEARQAMIDGIYKNNTPSLQKNIEQLKLRDLGLLYRHRRDSENFMRCANLMTAETLLGWFFDKVESA